MEQTTVALDVVLAIQNHPKIVHASKSVIGGAAEERTEKQLDKAGLVDYWRKDGEEKEEKEEKEEMEEKGGEEDERGEGGEAVETAVM